MHDVISVESLGNHRLRVRFDDGVEGVVDVRQMVPLSGHLGEHLGVVSL